MSDGDYHEDFEARGKQRWSPDLVWSVLLIVAICGIVLVSSYFGPRSLSPSYRATEIPPASATR
jgi:hypothetical protein